MNLITIYFRKKSIVCSIMALLLIALISVVLWNSLRVSKERQAVVDYLSSRFEIVSPSVIKYKGYSFEYGMDKFIMNYETQTEREFYVKKDDLFPIYTVYTKEELTADLPVEDIKGFMIAEDTSAVAFADQLMVNVDESFCYEEYPNIDVFFNEEKQYYTVSRKDDTQKEGYSVELWVNEKDTLHIKNARMKQASITSAFVTDPHEAEKLADIIMNTAYNDVQYIYPDITVETEDQEKWTVTRSDEETGTDGVCVKIHSNGVVFELIWLLGE